ncbi:MAG: class I SAM-dependent methyltransferase [Euryarchaeota archaeon]|nr:class I SAM-dependent methyltransferase [Euryarchaeota archaeon]
MFIERYLRGRILDVGCGSGFDVSYFHSKGCEIEGCDISEIAVEHAKKRFPGLKFFVHDFESSKFDKKI